MHFPPKQRTVPLPWSVPHPPSATLSKGGGQRGNKHRQQRRRHSRPGRRRIPPDLELRVDRGTPCETLVHRVHSDVKLSLFLLAALQVAPRARVAFVAGLSALRRVLVAA